MRFLLPILLLAPAPQQEPADWTILVYMTADNDLEGYAVDDLKRMMGAPQSDRVKVVVQVDRCEEDEGDEEMRYSGDEVAKLGNFKGAKRLLVQKGDLKELADLQETNTGDPKVLEEFLQWGMKTFPAKRTALIFWNHGYAWQGYGGDESHEDDMLELPELGPALRRFKFDLVGFDCCLMASLEVAAAVRGSARILVASEELVPGEGWNYDVILATLAKNPAITAEALGRTICSSFQEFYEKHPDEDVRDQAAWTTLAEIDVEKVAAVQKALDVLATKLSSTLKDRKSWLALAKARRNSEEHGAEEDPEESICQFDLYHFARNLGGLGVDPERKELMRAIESAVLFRVAGRDHAESRGFTIYFPPNEDMWIEEYEAASCSAAWLKLLGDFLKSGASDRDPPSLSNFAFDGKTASAKVEGDDIAELYLTLDDVGMIPVRALQAPFDGTWPTIGGVPLSVGSYEDLGDKFRCDVPASYLAPDSKEWKKITLRFELPSGKFLGAVMSTPMGPSVVKIRPGSKIRGTKVTVEERILREDAETPVATVGNEGVVLGKSKIAGKPGFIAVDFSGNAAKLTK